MAHTTIDDLAESVTIQLGAVVSKVVHRDQQLDVTVFGFDAGEGLTEHTASRPAIVQVLSGRLRCTVDGEDTRMVPGTWLHMERGAPHALVAEEPTTVLLTLLRSENDPG
jgi:quercetin dioxygenase-like cupin family protein